MKKILENGSKIFLPFVAIVLLSLTYFIWQPYDKCLFQITMAFDKITFIGFATRVIYYLVFFSALILINVSLFKNNLSQQRITKKSLPKIYGTLFLFRAIADLVIYLVNRIIIDDFAMVFCDFVLVESIFNIAVILFIANKVIPHNQNKLTSKRKAIIIFLVAVAVILFVALIVMYVNCSKLLYENRQAWEYRLYLCNMIRDIINNSLAIAIIFFAKADFAESEEPLLKSVSKVIIRLSAVLCLFVILNLAKFAVLPHSMIKTIKSVDGEVTSIVRVTDYKNAHETDDWLSLT